MIMTVLLLMMTVLMMMWQEDTPDRSLIQKDRLDIWREGVDSAAIVECREV